jgi:3-hydroxyanthranilate 3,4-dioxygenase
MSLPAELQSVKQMINMPIVNLLETGLELSKNGKRVNVLWQEVESLAFVARGREYRSEFHINPCDEVMFQIKGQMNLHYRTPDGKEEIAVIREGSVIYTPAGIPHSPRFPPDAYALILERKRREGEIDRFHWYCPKCDAFLHEETFVVHNYADDPVSKAYKRFFDHEEFRTCGQCRTVVPVP